jgi:hypothetical protein
MSFKSNPNWVLRILAMVGFMVVKPLAQSAVRVLVIYKILRCKNVKRWNVMTYRRCKNHQSIDVLNNVLDSWIETGEATETFDIFTIPGTRSDLFDAHVSETHTRGMSSKFSVWAYVILPTLSMLGMSRKRWIMKVMKPPVRPAWFSSSVVLRL